MKYKVTVTEKIGSPHQEIGTFEATNGIDAIKQAQQYYKPNFKPNWFATPCYEEGKQFYQWGREQ